MRERSILSMVVVLLLLAVGVTATQAGKSTATFEGKYDWAQGGNDELRVDFKPDGEDRWKVAFRFHFSGRKETWSGTAVGSLHDGSTLTGTATSGGRNWIFKAGIENGVMRGTHREVKRGGREYATGTFEVSR